MNMEFDIRGGFMGPYQEHHESHVTGYVATGPKFFPTLPPTNTHTY